MVNASLVMDLTRFAVILGYGYVVWRSLRNARHVTSQRGKVALRLVAFSAIAWVLFYVWVGGLPTFGSGATFNEVVLASRLAHVPTIGVFLAITFIVVDASNARDNAILREKASE